MYFDNEQHHLRNKFHWPINDIKKIYVDG